MPSPLNFVLLSRSVHIGFMKVAEHLQTDWKLSYVEQDESNPSYAAALAEADAALSMIWDASVPPAPRLRMLHLPGAGSNLVDMACVNPNAAVCNVHEHGIAIAEHLICTMLMGLIGIRETERRFRALDWSDSVTLNGPLHGELNGKTVGIVGYGGIGRALAIRLRAFGVRVMARTRTPANLDQAVDDGGGLDDLDTLLREADFVAVCLPLTEETRGLIGDAALRLMKPTAMLLNPSRGPIVDEDALYAALAERRIGGAALDTWYRYPNSVEERIPPSRHPFHELGNVIVTPHNSAWSDGTLGRRNKVIAANLDRLARGEPLSNVIRAAAG
jgi:phosphoglycerate dehydrogenase-like enzyme